MLIYLSPAEECYALCSEACLSFLREWHTNPDARIRPTERVKFVNGGDYVPYACTFCSLPIDPSDWGEKEGS